VTFPNFCGVVFQKSYRLFCGSFSTIPFLIMSSSRHEQWQRCLNFIQDNLNSPEQFAIFFQSLTFLKYENNELTIDAPSNFIVEGIEERYIGLVKAAVKKVYGPDTKLFYHINQVAGTPSSAVTLEASSPSPAVNNTARTSGAPLNPFAGKPIADVDSNLNPHYTFENYCGGNSNRVARSIGEAIAGNPRQMTFNPLFVFGPTGVGKTHLIQAIGIRIKERNPRMRVLYLPARLFETQFTSAMTDGKGNDFINFYQSIDVLIIDDIQDLVGKKPGTQNAFFHIFNHLHQNQKQLILSSDTRPSMMDGMDARLLSRFKWGMTAELEKPDLDLRKSFLSLKARRDGLEIPAEVMEYIAANVTDSIRELEGIVVSLLAHATVLNRDITLDLARNVIANAVKINRRQVNFEMIVDSVSAYYDVDADLIFSKVRKQDVSDARQIIMFLAKKLGKMPLTAIGARLSRSHATVLYACRVIEDRLTMDRKLQADLSKIEKSMLS